MITNKSSDVGGFCLVQMIGFDYVDCGHNIRQIDNFKQKIKSSGKKYTSSTFINNEIDNAY